MEYSYFLNEEGGLDAKAKLTDNKDNHNEKYKEDAIDDGDINKRMDTMTVCCGCW